MGLLVCCWLYCRIFTGVWQGEVDRGTGECYNVYSNGGGDRYVCDSEPVRSILPFTLHGLTQPSFIVNAEIQHASSVGACFFAAMKGLAMMVFNDTLMMDLTDAAVQKAFRAYYEELGVKVTNWEGLFAEISASPDCFFVRKNQNGEVIGFLLFVMTGAETACRGFFSTRLGWIEEFWIAPEYRKQTHGTALLHLAEKHFSQLGCAYAILTTDTALQFYEKRGYRLQKGVAARNKSNVYIKPLV